MGQPIEMVAVALVTCACYDKPSQTHPIFNSQKDNKTKHKSKAGIGL